MLKFKEKETKKIEFGKNKQYWIEYCYLSDAEREELQNMKDERYVVNYYKKAFVSWGGGELEKEPINDENIIELTSAFPTVCGKILKESCNLFDWAGGIFAPEHEKNSVGSLASS